MKNVVVTRSNLFALAGFILVFLLVLAAILNVNQGHFIYSLDDPYIHLALAENIARGHYGVNLSEYSAPSSSILWPYLLAPFTLPGWDQFAPLIIGLLSGLLTFAIILKMLEQWFPDSRKTVLVLTAFFALGTNLIGVIFTGMEHNLQILCSVLALYGIFRTETDQRVPWWLYLVLILGPLVRYENSLISLISGLYLLSRAYWWQTIITGAITLALLAAFSLYLHGMDLGYIASSIMVKSTVVEATTPLDRLLSRISLNVFSPGGVLMLIAWIMLLITAIKSGQGFQRKLSLLVMLALTCHFIAGRFGWFGRYELYMMMPVVLVLVYCHRDYLGKVVTKPLRHPFIIVYGLLFLLVYGSVLMQTPASSKNIYEQQYQMHRFATEYYPYPLAVNDLGWVSYRNDNYILDLWGLASAQAFSLRQQSESPEWMAQLSREKDVRLAIIYIHEYMLTEVPAQWQLLGSLETSGPPVAIVDSKVRFFATDEQYSDEISDALQQFKQTLPPEVKFSFAVPRADRNK